MKSLRINLLNTKYSSTRYAKKNSHESSLGIELSGNVVIFDEAHNIIETVNSVHSAILSDMQVSVALDQVRMEGNT